MTSIDSPQTNRMADSPQTKVLDSPQTTNSIDSPHTNGVDSPQTNRKTDSPQTKVMSDSPQMKLTNGWEHNNNELKETDANFDEPSCQDFQKYSKFDKIRRMSPVQRQQSNCSPKVQIPSPMPENRTQYLENQTQSPPNEVQVSENITLSLTKRIQFPENRTQSPKNPVQFTENRTQSPKNPVQFTENRTQSRQNPIQLPKNLTQLPKHQIQLENRSLSPFDQGSITKENRRTETHAQPLGPFRQISAESEGALVIDEFANTESSVLDEVPKLVLEEASDKEKEYIVQECSNNELRKLESVVANSVPVVAPALTSDTRVLPTDQKEIPHGQKRRKSENERLKGFSKKLKLKITPQNSLDKEDEKFNDKSVFSPKDPHSAPVLADAYNKGYQDASRLKELILKSKMTGIPFFPSIPSPLLLATPPPSTQTDMPKIELQLPSVPFSPVIPHPLTPHTPTGPPPLTPIARSPIRRLSPLAASPSSGSVTVTSIKQEPVSPPASVPTSTNFLKVPEPIFRTLSPLRNSSSPSSNPFTTYHDPDKPLDLSSDSKRNTPIPTPSPSALIPRLLLPRSFSMPLGIGSDSPHSSPFPEALESSSSATMIHPLALSGSSFTRQMSVSTPEQGPAGVVSGSSGSGSSGRSSGYMSMSSVEGDSDPSETETPSGNFGKISHRNVSYFELCSWYNTLVTKEIFSHLV